MSGRITKIEHGPNSPFTDDQIKQLNDLVARSYQLQDKFNRNYSEVIISTQPIKALSGFAPMRDAMWRRLWRWLVNALTGKEQKDG